MVILAWSPAGCDGEEGSGQKGAREEMVIHADGFGTRRQKIKKYNLLVRDQPVQYGGFKLFYYQDYDLLSPEEVLDVLEPNPAVVSYQ